MNFTTDKGDYTDFTIPLLLKNLQEKVHRCDIIYELWSIILEFKGQVLLSMLSQKELPLELFDTYTTEAFLPEISHKETLREQFRADIDRDSKNIDKLVELEQKMNRSPLNQDDEKEIAILLALEKDYEKIELKLIDEMKRELTEMIKTLTPDMESELAKKIKSTLMRLGLTEITALLTPEKESK